MVLVGLEYGLDAWIRLVSIQDYKDYISHITKDIKP